MLADFDQRCEGLVMVQMRRIGIERRRALAEKELVGFGNSFSKFRFCKVV